jgi:hypothetical protein
MNRGDVVVDGRDKVTPYPLPSETGQMPAAGRFPPTVRNTPVHAKDDAFGPVLRRCRPRSAVDWMMAQGFNWLYCYILLPVIVIPFFAFLVPAMVLHFLFPDLDAESSRPILFGSFIGCYLLLAWLVYVQPRNDYLVLHEDGFRIGIMFKQRTVAFANLAELRLGRSITAPETVIRQLANIKKPHTSAWLAELDRTALTIVMKDGTTSVFKTFMLRFDPVDTVEFLEHVAQNHGGVVLAES